MAHHYIISHNAIDGYYIGRCKYCPATKTFPANVSDHFTRGAITHETDEIEIITEAIKSAWGRARVKQGLNG